MRSVQIYIYLSVTALAVAIFGSSLPNSIFSRLM